APGSLIRLSPPAPTLANLSSVHTAEIARPRGLVRSNASASSIALRTRCARRIRTGEHRIACGRVGFSQDRERGYSPSYLRTPANLELLHRDFVEVVKQNVSTKTHL